MLPSHRFTVLAGVLGTVCIGAGAFCLQPPSPKVSPKEQAKKQSPLASPIPATAAYRKWTKVNPKPTRFVGASAAQCRTPDPSQIESPHLDKYIAVYVNSIGKKEMRKPVPKHFPVGTIIIKEKLTSATGQTPELLTVMKKRAKGFAPNEGDWEYFVLNGTATEVKAGGKLKNCQTCHQQISRQDFVFRNYSPLYSTTRP